MNRTLALVYGVVTYALFLLAFLYLIGFVGGIAVPKSIDAGPPAPLATAVLIDVLLVALFGLQHGIMARPWFKRLWTRVVPAPIERSTFVLASVLVLGLLFWQWRPITETVWNLEGTAVGTVLQLVFGVGFGVVLISTFLIDHFDLFGLRQVFLFWKGKPYTAAPFQERGFYRHVRHPLMLGFLVAFWAAPHMTAGHLLFALAFTSYVLVALRIEERDLLRAHPGAYADYRRRVPMLIPLRGRRAGDPRA